MTILKNIGTAIGLAAAFLGRAYIGAHAVKLTKDVTDKYIRFTGGSMMVIIAAIAMNAVFMWMGWPVAQMGLAVFMTLVMLYHGLSPAIAPTLVGIGTAYQAVEEGDQPNGEMVRNAMNGLLKVLGIVDFFILVYVIATIIVPFELYPKIFGLVHIMMLGMLFLLLTGKVDASPDWANKSFRSILVMLVGVILLGATFQEGIAPYVAQMTARQGARVEAIGNANSITLADEAFAKWYKKHVQIDSEGVKWVIIEEQGVKKKAHAEAYIAAEKAKQSKTVERALRSEVSNINPLPTAFFGGLLALAGLAIYVGFRTPRAKKGVATTSKETKGATKETNSKSGSAMSVALAAIVFGSLLALYTGYIDMPDGLKGAASSQEKSRQSVVSLGESWHAQWTNWNSHKLYQLPHDNFAGQDLKVVHGGYFDASTLVASIEFDQTLTLKLVGMAEKPRPGIAQAYTGVWSTNETEAAFRCEIEKYDTNVECYLYKNKTLPAVGQQAQQSVIKKVSFNKNV